MNEEPQQPPPPIDKVALALGFLSLAIAVLGLSWQAVSIYKQYRQVRQMAKS